MIYLDNAATTGRKPQSVIQAVNNALREYSANPGRSGHKPSQKAAMLVYRAREKVADFFGAPGPETVAFTANCTHSLNCVIKGVLKAGDHAVVSSLEHNAVMRPLYKTGVEYSTAKVSLNDDRQTLEEFRHALRPNTRLVVCTGASNVLGKMLPISEIGALCRSRGILFAVDAAQTAGVVEIDMQAQNIDYLCIAPHKGLYAPMGIGVLIAAKPIENTVIEGGTGTNSVNFAQPDTLPEQIESGTVNLPGIAGISAGIDYINQIGIKKIHSYEMKLITSLYDRLTRLPNIVLYAPRPTESGFVPVLSFNLADVPSSVLAAYLDENGIAVRAGLHCAPAAHRQMKTIETGAVRVCVGVFNTQQEINRLAGVLEKKIV